MSHLDEGTLHALLDGELQTTEVAEIQAHLGSCSACGLRLREAKEFLGEADRMIAAVDLGPGLRPPALPPRADSPAAPPVSAEAPVEPPKARPRPRPPLAEKPPLVPPELRSEQAVILIPDNESPAARRLRRIRWLGWAAMVAVIVGSATVWAGKFGVHIGGAPDTTAAPTAVVSPQETAPVERQAFAPDSSTVAVAAKSPSRRVPAPAESAPAPRKKPSPAAPAAPKPKLAASAPAARDSAVAAESTSTTDSSGNAPSQAAATDSVAPENIADVRARAAEALAQLDREKRRNQAAAATAALDSEKRRRAAPVTQPAAAVVPTPPTPPTMEQRAHVYLRIGLDEAFRQLGGPAHVIEGMSPVFMGLAQGGAVAGADATRPVVRVVYQDAQGRLIILDQQRIRPGQPTPKGSQVAWTQGDIAMWLNGEVNPEVLRTLRPRVR